MKILWLCSWYPHAEQPYEGDFIQRHAGAVSGYSPLAVFYVCQDGADTEIEKPAIISKQYMAVTETVIYFRFKRTGLKLFDKLLYNYKYYKNYKKNIAKFIARQGKPDIVHVHVPMKAGMIARWIKKRWGIPYILSEHSSHYNGNTDDDFSKRTNLYQSQVRQIFRGAKMVTNVSTTIGEKLKKMFGLKEVRIVRNTVDTSIFYQNNVRPSRFRFIHVSTLSSFQKNIEGLVNAFLSLLQQRQDFELVIVGPAGDELKKWVTGSALGSYVHFTGEIAYAEVAKQMRQASAFVLFSRFENFPCVIIEALCCGLPVISTDTGGTSEAIDDSNGILVESENESQLTGALNMIIENYSRYDPGMIAKRASLKYNYEAIGKEFYELYLELLRESSKQINET